MITGINKSRTARHISCKCGCKFDCRKWKLNQKWNNNKCWCECKSLKEHCCAKKVIFEFLQHLAGEMLNMQEVLLAIQ